ncbi:MAG: acyl-CoA dehydrogenase family protein, partial [Vicinamibacteria bacterium]
SGEIRFALAMTEPQAGSDLSAIETTARRDGESYVINGTKTFCCGAHVAHRIVTLAKTGNLENPLKTMTLLIVESGAPGLTIRPLDQLGHRAVTSCEVVYRNVRVPLASRIGEENEGFRAVMKTVSIDRIAAAAVCVGMAQVAFDDAAEHAKTRVQFGKPIAKHQAIRHTLAELATEIDAARLATYHAARLASGGGRHERESAVAKLWASRTCMRAAERGMQILGGYSNLMEHDMQRYYRDAKAMEIAAGTSEMQKNQIARSIGVA